MNDSEALSGVGRFLTLADTAEILALTTAEVLELVRTGELPAIRLGTHGAGAPTADSTAAAGVWRVERIVLESFIEAKYEEARRLSLWEQSDFANIPELSGGTIIRPDE